MQRDISADFTLQQPVNESNSTATPVMVAERSCQQGWTIEQKQVRDTCVVPTISKPAPQWRRQKKTITVSSAWFREHAGATPALAPSLSTQTKSQHARGNVAVASAKAYVIGGDAGWSGGPGELEAGEIDKATVVHVALAAPEPVLVDLQASDERALNPRADASLPLHADAGAQRVHSERTTSVAGNNLHACGTPQSRTATLTERKDTNRSRGQEKTSDLNRAAKGPGLVKAEWQKQGICSVFGCGMPSVSACCLFFARALFLRSLGTQLAFEKFCVRPPLHHTPLHLEVLVRRPHPNESSCPDSRAS